MNYNKYISKRGGMYHRKRKRSTPPLPSSFFIKKRKKIKVRSYQRLFSWGLEAILVGVVWYHMIQSRHITGNPLNFFPLCLIHSSACDSSHAVTYMGLTGFNATYCPAHKCLLAHILKHSPCCFFCVCFHFSNSI